MVCLSVSVIGRGSKLNTERLAIFEEAQRDAEGQQIAQDKLFQCPLVWARGVHLSANRTRVSANTTDSQTSISTVTK